MLRLISLKYWYIQLIIQFKERTLNVLQILQIEKYLITDAQEGKNLHIYAQLLFCHAKAA